MSVLGRFLSAAATGLAVLVAGVLSATVLGGFAVVEPRAPAGSRFLLLEFIAIAVLLSVPVAIAAACWVLLRPGSRSRQAWSPARRGLF